ncbi:hypothetical protein [Granulosicoccus antarcticus]|uniref:Toxin co-regulated pilus biosynthesis protein Q C-terminal domain-containing protein n=1 Tax=Granulosicoccus antarcticus IMCC3135 TaxID=1192854 RepID=A0A2Z2P297_9GAMM|nr:hypothetical protein [Granulosicoccus antarcticus]ASJ74657.1 hypothetical protein IMCC3135_22935 [Granulosicoccus antarcticus IMCC3135]
MKTATSQIILPLSFFVAWMSLSSTLLASTVGETLAAVSIPFGAQVQSVGDDVVHNQQAMALATYESSLSIEDTIAYYDQLWPAEADKSPPGLTRPGLTRPDRPRPGLLANRTAEWLMLGHLQGDIQIVLQLRLSDPGKSSGFLSAMQIKSDSSAPSSQTPLPGLERLSTTQSQDGKRSSVLSVYSSRQSAQSLARQFEKHWQAKGWTLVSSETYKGSRILLLNRDSAQMEIVISNAASDGTLVVLNEVDDHG